MSQEKKFVITLKKKDYGGYFNKEIEISSSDHEKIIKEIRKGVESIIVNGNYIPVSSILCIDED